MKFSPTHIASFAVGATVTLIGFGIGSIAWSEDSKQSEFDQTKVDAIEEIIFDYLMENPEVIIQAVDVLQAREAAAEEARVAQAVIDNKEAIYASPSTMVMGNPDGDITIVEFFDYHCTYCKRGFPGLMAAVNKDKNIKLVLKEYPVLGEASVVASRAALAADRQGKYPEYHVALMQASGKLTQDRLESIAKDVGINVKQLRSDMKDPIIAANVETNRNLAHELGITGTPSFVIEDQVFHGMMDQEVVTQIVSDLRKASAQQASTQ